MTSWGILTSIDLKGCSPIIIRSLIAISDYVSELIKLLDMKPYGYPQIVHFGSKETEGYTLVQLIETSSITGHFVNETNEAFIDIFSCKPYDADQAATFTCRYFKAEKSCYDVIRRGTWDDD
jgi:S-adenosylmethionine/arginine decarboxylase-like enzyme